MELLKTNLVRDALASQRVVSLLKKTVPRMDKFLLRNSRGWVNTGMQSVAMLTTTGAKSGARREIVTLCMPLGNAIVLVGSNWGQERDPAWVHNLRAHPEATVLFRGYKGTMKASELQGRERALLWEQLVEYNPQYAVYQDGTSRRLPVILMERSNT